MTSLLLAQVFCKVCNYISRVNITLISVQDPCTYVTEVEESDIRINAGNIITNNKLSTELRCHCGSKMNLFFTFSDLVSLNRAVLSSTQASNSRASGVVNGDTSGTHDVALGYFQPYSHVNMSSSVISFLL